jgi:hypothetical protein
MNDVERNDDIPSSSSLSKLAISAVGFTAGGVFLFLLQIFSRLRGLGLVVGAVVCVIGIVSLMSKETADKKAGAFIAAAGALILLSKIPMIAPIAATLLTIGSFALLGKGIWNGIRFFIGLSKRS